MCADSLEGTWLGNRPFKFPSCIAEPGKTKTSLPEMFLLKSDFWVLAQESLQMRRFFLCSSVDSSFTLVCTNAIFSDNLPNFKTMNHTVRLKSIAHDQLS